MNSRFRKLAVESLEGRSVLSTMVEADFNGDGFLDEAAITDPSAITVSLLDPVDGGYDVSEVLTAPKNQTFVDIGTVHDYFDQDGDLDLQTISQDRSGDLKVASFRNNGDGTFEYNQPIEPVKWKGRPIRWL